MELLRDAKITRTRLQSIAVRKIKKEGRICFCINGVEFIAVNHYECEKDFYEYLLSGKRIICTHIFEMDLIDVEEKHCYNIWIEGDFAVFIQVF